MRMLITGGAGFIGSNFVRYVLQNRPDLVEIMIVLDILTYAGNLHRLYDLLKSESSKLLFVKGDICDRELVESLLKKHELDTVVHFAAETHVDRSILGAEVFVRTNVLGTQVLADCALKSKIKRFHHISTDEVFGSLALGTKEKFNECTPYNPSSPYSASKAGSDFLVKALFRTLGLPAVITNCSNNYGSYQFPEKLIPLFVTNLLDGNKVPLYGDGKNVRDWLHVDDHCRAILLVLEKGRVGETYCIGGDNELSNLQITEMILEIMGKGREFIQMVEDRKGHDRRYAIDFSKIRNELGFTPLIPFEQGLRDTIEWYRANERWWRDVKSGQYQYFQEAYGGKCC